MIEFTSSTYRGDRYRLVTEIGLGGRPVPPLVAGSTISRIGIDFLVNFVKLSGEMASGLYQMSGAELAVSDRAA